MTRIVGATPQQSADRTRWDVTFVVEEPPDTWWCDQFAAQTVYFQGDGNGPSDFIPTSRDARNYHPRFTSHNTFLWPHILERDIRYAVKAVKRALDHVHGLHAQRAARPVTSAAAVAQVVAAGMKQEELNILLDELLSDEPDGRA